MENKEPTAVEWLEEQMKTWGNLPRWMRDDIMEKAKQIEKEKQELFAIHFGKKVADHWGMTTVPTATIEKFYGETFKSERDDKTNG